MGAALRLSPVLLALFPVRVTLLALSEDDTAGWAGVRCRSCADASARSGMGLFLRRSCVGADTADRVSPRDDDGGAGSMLWGRLLYSQKAKTSSTASSGPVVRCEFMRCGSGPSPC